jgi:hypothetical protein
MLPPRPTPWSKRLLLGGGGAGVDELGVVVDDTLDETLLLEDGAGAAGERAVVDDAVAAGGEARSEAERGATKGNGGKRSRTDEEWAGRSRGSEKRREKRRNQVSDALPRESIETPTR